MCLLHYTCIFTFFNKTTFYLFASVADGGEWLSQGRHIFHFSFMLPSLLPSSYNDKYGTIEYEVSAILDQDFWSSKEITRREFKVVSDVDLNKYPEAEVLILIKYKATYRAGGLSFLLFKIRMPNDHFLTKILNTNWPLNNFKKVFIMKVKRKDKVKIAASEAN